ncbi:MAG TPA: glutathione S-transferase [Alphaproteobacteria bacterium]|nr:glutathione S-transferase [Alphaproteobacteria bacterium]
MVKLVGFAVSNYYNKVRLAMLEKGVPHSEELNWADKDEATLARSPLGKVPFIDTDAGPLCESQVIMEYLEDAHPERPLLPGDAYERAKVRELVTFLEVHLELVARRLYPEAFFGGKVSDETKEQVRKELARNVAAFGRLARFSPYVAGSEFTMADCAAIVHLPLVSGATKAIYGEDLLASLPVKEYLKQMGARESVRQITAARKANLEQMAQRNKR